MWKVDRQPNDQDHPQSQCSILLYYTTPFKLIGLYIYICHLRSHHARLQSHGRLRRHVCHHHAMVRVATDLSDRNEQERGTFEPKRLGFLDLVLYAWRIKLALLFGFGPSLLGWRPIAIRSQRRTRTRRGEGSFLFLLSSRDSESVATQTHSAVRVTRSQHYKRLSKGMHQDQGVALAPLAKARASMSNAAFST